MKLILSRKGFDSGSGGCPSPIFPDGSMLALPIPDKRSRIRYEDLQWNGRSVGDLLSALAGAKPKPRHFAHLDPDLRADAYPRPPEWRPIFGQHGSAQGHLAKQGVGVGDLFLFFGLFRPVAEDGSFDPARRSAHLLWGWLQVGEVVPVDTGRDRISWADHHPHLNWGADPTNTVYIAAERLHLPRLRERRASDRSAPIHRIPGAGVFPRFVPALQLTAAGSEKVSTWRLPKWFHPANRRSALSYHGNPARWRLDGESVLLSAVGRGQEFVLDCDDYPEAGEWAARIVEAGCGAVG